MQLLTSKLYKQKATNICIEAETQDSFLMTKVINFLFLQMAFKCFYKTLSVMKKPNHWSKKINDILIFS